MNNQLSELLDRALVEINKYAIICSTQKVATEAWALLEALSKHHGGRFPYDVEMVQLPNGSLIRVFHQEYQWRMFNPIDGFPVKVFTLAAENAEPRFGL